MSSKTSKDSSATPTAHAAEVVREYGPFAGADHIHGVSYDGERVWAATGPRLLAFDPESGDTTRTLDHVVHLAVKALCKPLPEARLGTRQIDTRNPDLGESKFPGQRPNPTHELMAADHLPIVETHSVTRVWRTESDTQALARALASSPALRDAFISLQGDLGAGKTTFVRHLLRSLGITGRIKSPTYAVVEPHEAPDGLAIFHFDFYRFSDPREWEDAGFRDIFAGPGVKLAEWPENAAGRIPLADLAIKIEAMTDDTRTVTLRANTERGSRLLNAA